MATGDLGDCPNLLITAPNSGNPLLTGAFTDSTDDEELELRALLRDFDSMSEGTNSVNSSATDDDDDLEFWEEQPPNPQKRHRTGEKQANNIPFSTHDNGHLNCIGLRQTALRSRKLAHDNGLPAIIQWLQAGGQTLQRFVAGQMHLSQRDKQEVDCHLHNLLLIADQVRPDHLALLDVTDSLIRRIMVLCLQTKLDADFLEVFSNPSGSHLAPLGLLSEANKVFQVIKKARGLDLKSQSLLAAPVLPQSSRVVQLPQPHQQAQAMMPHMFPSPYPMPHFPQYPHMMQLPPPPAPTPLPVLGTSQTHAVENGKKDQGTKPGKQGATKGARASGKN